MIHLLKTIFRPDPVKRAERAIAQALKETDRARVIRLAGLDAVRKALDSPA